MMQGTTLFFVIFFFCETGASLCRPWFPKCPWSSERSLLQDLAK